MKSKLTLVVAMATACAAVQLAAMPTAEETRRAEPVPSAIHGLTDWKRLGDVLR